MIRDHDFNCTWWGARVGILEDAAFFSEPAEKRTAELAPYSWVEFRCALDEAPDPWRLSDAGFAQVDTQLKFRIGLGRIAASTEPLTVRFASEEPFALPEKDWPDFIHERFRHLPDTTAKKVSERYSIWGAGLLTRSPEWCVEVGRDGQAEGWFLAEPEGGHLNLALAMTRRGATISGLDFYAAALRAFGERGARLGEARFSIENRPVHNIYARLGAVFLDAIGCWMWSAR
ncbi:MAG: hypothetical protein ABI592_02200 [Acidobacteriota bacterium]